MEDTQYHVLLGGRRLGPYDRRTIVGMRMKKALASKDMLEATTGAQLTVAQLVRGEAPEPPAPDPVPFDPSRSGSHSVVQAMHMADLLGVHGSAYEVPPFEGEVEVRVQTRALRIAGRYREGRRWKEDRVKFALPDVIHARLQGNVVELGVRPPAGEGLQRLRLDLRSAEAAGELVEGLTHTVPWPGSEPLAGSAHGTGTAQPRWKAVVLAGSAVAAAAILVWLLALRA